MLRWKRNPKTPPPVDQNSFLAEILHQDVVAAVLLLLAALAAMLMVNLGYEEAYHRFLDTHWGFQLYGVTFEQNLHFWINEGLMAIFFFLMGLEIKRELVAGELASIRRATLPAVAAFGGMACPALIYALLNAGKPTLDGWGIPMATDIAFAIGCISLVGSRVPVGLSVFLIALAIVDDLGSVLVIALFYSEGLSLRPLLIGHGLIAFSFLMNFVGIRWTPLYVLIWVLIWFEFLESGVHATVAGVLIAFTIPANATYETPLFNERMKTLLERFRQADDLDTPLQVNARQQSLIRHMINECNHVEAPLQRIERKLHPFTMLLIMPLFAFANSGLHINWSGLGEALTRSVAPGVILGLLLGKQIGIMGCCALAVRLGLAELPTGVTWRMLYGMTWLAGIGFTMALFISQLAFVGEPQHLDDARIGTFLASLLAGVVGVLFLRWVCPPAPETENGNNAGRTERPATA